MAQLNISSSQATYNTFTNYNPGASSPGVTSTYTPSFSNFNVGSSAPPVITSPAAPTAYSPTTYSPLTVPGVNVAQDLMYNTSAQNQFLYGSRAGAASLFGGGGVSAPGSTGGSLDNLTGLSARKEIIGGTQVTLGGSVTIGAEPPLNAQGEYPIGYSDGVPYYRSDVENMPNVQALTEPPAVPPPAPPPPTGTGTEAGDRPAVTYYEGQSPVRAAVSGFAEGAKEGLSIVANTLTGGYFDKKGITDTSSLSGAEYEFSRRAAEVGGTALALAAPVGRIAKAGQIARRVGKVAVGAAATVGGYFGYDALTGVGDQEQQELNTIDKTYLKDDYFAVRESQGIVNAEDGELRVRYLDDKVNDLSSNPLKFELPPAGDPTGARTLRTYTDDLTNYSRKDVMELRRLEKEVVTASKNLNREYLRRGKEQPDGTYVIDPDYYSDVIESMSAVSTATASLKSFVESRAIGETSTAIEEQQSVKVQELTGLDPNSLTKSQYESALEAVDKYSALTGGPGTNAFFKKYTYDTNWAGDAQVNDYVNSRIKDFPGKTADEVAREVLFSEDSFVDPLKPPTEETRAIWESNVIDRGPAVRSDDPKLVGLADWVASQTGVDSKDPSYNNIRQRAIDSISNDEVAAQLGKYNSEMSRVQARRNLVNGQRSTGTRDPNQITEAEVTTIVNNDPNIKAIKAEYDNQRKIINDPKSDAAAIAAADIRAKELRDQLDTASLDIRDDLVRVQGKEIVSTAPDSGSLAQYDAEQDSIINTMQETVDKFTNSVARSKGDMVLAEARVARNKYDREIKRLQDQYVNDPTMTDKTYQRQIEDAQASYEEQINLLNMRMSNVTTNNGEFYERGGFLPTRVDAFGETQSRDWKEMIGILALGTGLLLPLYQELYSRPKETEEAFERQKELMALQFEYWKQQLALETGASGGGGGGGGSGEGSGTTSGNTSFTLASV